MKRPRDREIRVSALPSAPDDRERILYVYPKNRALSVTQLIAWVGLSLALFLFSLNKVFWWNYVLLVPALLQTFVFLPLWHRQRYGLDAMRAKLVYAWAPGSPSATA